MPLMLYTRVLSSLISTRIVLLQAFGYALSTLETGHQVAVPSLIGTPIGSLRSYQQFYCALSLVRVATSFL
jgi:hypothetical protein